MVYLVLFLSAFVSATLFPLGSEALLIYNLTQGYSVALLLLVATIGNTLGSCVNYYLGYKGEAYCEQKGYIKSDKIAKYQHYFNRFGPLVLLFSWAPIIGDPLTFIAGILKYNFRYFVLLVVCAKFIRYAILAYVTLYNL